MVVSRCFVNDLVDIVSSGPEIANQEDGLEIRSNVAFVTLSYSTAQLRRFGPDDLTIVVQWRL